MALKRYVIVSRRLVPEAPILMDVTEENGVTELSMRLELGRFLEEVVKEVGSPAGLFRESALLERVQAAADAVVLKMKMESTRVM